MQKIESQKTTIYVVGTVIFFMMTSIIFRTLSMFDMPKVAFLSIPLIGIVIFFVMYALSSNSVEFHEDKVVVYNGNDDGITFLLDELEEAYRMKQMVKGVSVGGDDMIKNVVEFLFVFKLKDGAEVKFNELTYSKKSKQKLEQYLYSKGFVVTDKGYTTV